MCFPNIGQHRVDILSYHKSVIFYKYFSKTTVPFYKDYIILTSFVLFFDIYNTVTIIYIFVRIYNKNSNSNEYIPINTHTEMFLYIGNSDGPI